MVTTFINDGEKMFVCEDCGSHRKIMMGTTKCTECGAWYEAEIRKTVPGKSQ